MMWDIEEQTRKHLKPAKSYQGSLVGLMKKCLFSDGSDLLK